MKSSWTYSIALDTSTGLHQLDIVVQKTMSNFFHDNFYGKLTGLIGYLRQQQNLINNMKATCPKDTNTRWLSLGRVSKWLLKKYIPVSDHLELKQPTCAPPCEWLIYFSDVKVVMVDHVDVIFKELQGLTAQFLQLEESSKK